MTCSQGQVQRKLCSTKTRRLTPFFLSFKMCVLDQSSSNRKLVCARTFFLCQFEANVNTQKRRISDFFNQGCLACIQNYERLLLHFFLCFYHRIDNLDQIMSKNKQKMLLFTFRSKFQGFYKNCINFQKITFFPSSKILFDLNVDFFLLLHLVLLLNYEKKSYIYGQLLLCHTIFHQNKLFILNLTKNPFLRHNM